VRNAASASLVCAPHCMPRRFCRRATLRSLASSPNPLPMERRCRRRARSLGIHSAIAASPLQQDGLTPDLPRAYPAYTLQRGRLSGRATPPVWGSAGARCARCSRLPNHPGRWSHPQAGVKDLDPATPISYDELLALGKKLTVRKGGKTVVYGLDLAWSFGWVYMQIVQSLAQTGKTLWNSDYTQARFTDPDVLKILRWYVDWAQARVGHSPLDPDPDGWAAPAFEADRLALVVCQLLSETLMASGRGFRPCVKKGLTNH